jgi:hypothetical protein
VRDRLRFGHDHRAWGIARNRLRLGHDHRARGIARNRLRLGHERWLGLRRRHRNRLRRPALELRLVDSLPHPLLSLRAPRAKAKAALRGYLPPGEPGKVTAGPPPEESR